MGLEPAVSPQCRLCSNLPLQVSTPGAVSVSHWDPSGSLPSCSLIKPHPGLHPACHLWLCPHSWGFSSAPSCQVVPTAEQSPGSGPFPFPGSQWKGKRNEEGAESDWQIWSLLSQEEGVYNGVGADGSCNPQLHHACVEVTWPVPQSQFLLSVQGTAVDREPLPQLYRSSRICTDAGEMHRDPGPSVSA